MRHRMLLGLMVLAAACSAAMWWWQTRDGRVSDQIVLHGNVDLRQVDLAFNNAERIAAVLVREGEAVRRGQVLARLDTSRLEPQLEEAEAQVAAQRQVVQRLRNGSRPEEIAQARANVDAAKAEEVNARRRDDRLRNLVGVNAAAPLELDDARVALDAAAARLLAAQKGLELIVAGPRQEEVAEAEARLRAADAAVELLRRCIADAQLVAPVDSIVRSRLLEPGEMASPQRPVFSLAVTDPKWVRAYVSETDLGRVHSGMGARVGVDSWPGREFEGWVGFLSSVAEFTPKAVQTEELRSSLVYEVRVFVKDPGDELRLGMPASVHLPVRPAGGTTCRPGTIEASPRSMGGGL